MSNRGRERDTLEGEWRDVARHAAVATAETAPCAELSVASGEVGARKGAGILRANAIGSCVVATAYDAHTGVGGMAHVMLPGASRDQRPSRKTRYAEDAVEEMMREMVVLGAKAARVHVSLIGGANVLGDGHDSPGPEIVQSLSEVLGGMGVRLVATEVGGTQRRSCALDVACRRVTYTIGDSEQRVLWQAAEEVTA